MSMAWKKECVIVRNGTVYQTYQITSMVSLSFVSVSETKILTPSDIDRITSGRQGRALIGRPTQSTRFYWNMVISIIHYNKLLILLKLLEH